jgi:hypothetical protein
MANLEKEALEYLEMGFSVIPVKLDKKPVLPSWVEYQKRKPTRAEVSNWFTGYDNIAGVAIITGAVSGLVVLDLEEGADITGLEIPHTPTAKTGGGGRHGYFKHPGFQVKNSAKQLGPKIDVRGDGGYVVAPPSISSKGAYEWLIDLDTPLAPMPEWLVKKPQASAEIQRDDSAANKILPADAKPIEQDKTWGDILRGVEEGRRHDSATRIAGKLLRHFPSKDHDRFVLPAFEAWNGLNIPPLEPQELRSIYISLKQKHESANPEKAPKHERQLLTASDLLKMPDDEKPEFLINMLVPENGITALSGHPGVGKSWIMLHMAQCVATGARFLDEFGTKQGNVLVVDEESGKWNLKDRIHMLGYPDDIPVYFYSQNGFKVDEKEDLDKLLETVAEKDIKLVIIDPFVAIHSKVENSAEEAHAVMEFLQRFNSIGAAVLMIHHHRKGGIGGGGLSLRGSSAFSGRLDSHITVSSADKSLNPLNLDIEQEKSRRGSKVAPFRIALLQNMETGSMSASI